jgi:hypothetical protein
MASPSRAQWGSIALYGAENPFVGAGRVHRSWSIVVEMDRTRNGSNAPSPAPREHVRIDPVDLHSFVRQRLLEMRDAVPSPPERLGRLHISDHLAVRGTFTRLDWERSATARSWGGQSHPLIDPSSGLPHFAAPAETVAAAIRHPQGGLRYYQRVTVGAEAPEVRSPAGHLPAPGAVRRSPARTGTAPPPGVQISCSARSGRPYRAARGFHSARNLLFAAVAFSEKERPSR